MISAEISQVQSWQQDEEGLTWNDTDVATLEIQANQTTSQIDLYQVMLSQMLEIEITCGNEVNIIS